MIKIGPAGATTLGEAWDDGGRGKISQIFIEHEDDIHYLQFLYFKNGNLVLSDKHGGNTDCAHARAPKFDVVKLDYPSEYITGISGFSGYGFCDAEKRISSITFTTNRRTYGPFGAKNPGIFRDHDSEFEYQVGLGQQFGGFHGRADEYLNAIGFYVKPTKRCPRHRSKYQKFQVPRRDQLCGLIAAAE